MPLTCLALKNKAMQGVQPPTRSCFFLLIWNIGAAFSAIDKLVITVSWYLGRQEHMLLFFFLNLFYLKQVLSCGWISLDKAADRIPKRSKTYRCTVSHRRLMILEK